MVRMDLFRSEEMVLVQLIMPAESAHDTITYLAELSLLQFRDVSPETPKLFSMSPPSLLHLLGLFLLSSDPHSFVRTFKIQMFMVLFLSNPFAHNDGSGLFGY
jgi:hypothetical protein